MIPGDGAFMKAPATGWSSIARASRARSRFDRLPMLVRDRAAADRAQVAGAPALVGKPLHVARVRVEIRRRGPRDVADLEPAQPVADVCGVADLAHLAVADHVDARLDLMTHAVEDRLVEQPVIALLVDRLAAILGEHQFDELRRPGQAADVGGKDARHLPELLE